LTYEEPPAESDDHLSVTPASFPAVITENQDSGVHKYLYKDGDPHLGEIPPALLQVLDREIVNVPPPRPAPVPEYPSSRYKQPPGWSPTSDGSKTTYLDALKPELQLQENDWRIAPFNGWISPLNDFSQNQKQKKTALPKIQYNFTDSSRHSGMAGEKERDKVVQYRQKLVRNAFLHSWEGYKKVAWGHDEMKPVSGTAQDPFNGWGATIVDALDTLLVMDLPKEYDYARQHVRDIDFNLLGGERSAYGRSDGRIPVFETAIRYFGGFLSAYDLSGDVLMKDRAEELAQLLLPAFDTKTGVPIGRIRLGQRAHMGSQGGVILAEAASMLFEMTRLLQVTGNRTYFDKVQRTTDWLDRNMTHTSERLGSLWSTTIFPERGSMYGWFTWGGMADSAFEYLIKEHQLLGGQLDQYGRMFAGSEQWKDVQCQIRASSLLCGRLHGTEW
jgi:mannosyl-oligosaccharide alpha-1,2-mannosidase